MELVENAYPNELCTYIKDAYKKVENEGQEDLIELKRLIIDPLPNGKAKGDLLVAMRKDFESVYKIIASIEFQSEIESYDSSIQKDIKENCQLFMIKYNSRKDIGGLTDRLEEAELELIDERKKNQDLSTKLNSANQKFDSYQHIIDKRDKTISKLYEEIDQLNKKVDQLSLPFDVRTSKIADILAIYTEVKKENKIFKKKLEERDIKYEELQQKHLDHKEETDEIIETLNKMIENDRRKNFR